MGEEGIGVTTPAAGVVHKPSAVVAGAKMARRLADRGRASGTRSASVDLSQDSTSGELLQ